MEPNVFDISNQVINLTILTVLLCFRGYLGKSVYWLCLLEE